MSQEAVIFMVDCHEDFDCHTAFDIAASEK
jgi:hypothetical protein